jgi:putative redox protein
MGHIEAVVEQVGSSTSNGTVRTHTVVIDRPAAKGGTDRGPMGGEYLLIALGGCFMSNLLAAARTREAEIAGARVKVTGTIEGTPERFTAFTLSIAATCEPETLRKLVTVAERACIVSNTLKEVGAISILFDEAQAVETLKAS